MKKGYLWLIIFNLLYVVGFTIYYASAGNYEFLIYIAVLVVIGLIVLTTLSKSRLDNFALWGLSIWGFLHMVGGGVQIAGQTVYRLKLINIIDKGGDFFILKMDQVIHFYGFLVAAIVVYQLLSNFFSNRGDSPKMAVFLAWIGSMGLGALNEVIEFIAFVALAETGVGDLYNTGLDLVFNMCGAFVGALIQHKRFKKISA